MKGRLWCLAVAAAAICAVYSLSRAGIFWSRRGDESSSGTLARYAVLLRDMDGRSFCSGVLIGPKRVLTARHCLRNEHDLNFTLEFAAAPGGPTQLNAKPLAIRRLSTGKALFPLADLAEISFAGTLPAAVAPARLSRADFAIGHGTQLQVLGFGRTGAAIASTVTYDQSWNGDRVFGLFTAETPHQEGPCFGDSGGGVYAFASGEWQLVGLVAGTWAVFGRDEMRCEDSLALFTDLRRYQSWLSGSGSMPLENMVDGTRNSPQNSDSAFAAACRDQAVGSEAWRTTQELLLESATGQVLAAGERPIDGLLDCTLGARWATAFAAKGSEFSLHQTRDLQPLQLLPQVTALTLRSPEVEDWSPLLRQPSLRSLTVIGSSEPIRLAQLIQLPKLTTLRLEYVTLVESAAQARAMEDRLRSLSFTKHDVKTAASTLEELIQH